MVCFRSTTQIRYQVRVRLNGFVVAERKHVKRYKETIELKLFEWVDELAMHCDTKLMKPMTFPHPLE